MIGSRLSQKFIDVRRAAAGYKPVATSTLPAPVPTVPMPTPVATRPPPLTRDVAAHFDTFQASPGMSVAGGSAFTGYHFDTGAYRSDSVVDMDDDGDDALMADDVPDVPDEVRVAGEDGSTLAYKHGSISLSQVRGYHTWLTQARRLALQTMSRAV